jgi:predicted alpha/beta superfamily hydrolase
MKSFKLLLLFLVLGFNSKAQNDFDISLNSKILETERKIKIHLPKSYEKNKEKNYPMILVLDAEHTFYFTVGNTEIMYDPDPDFEIIPETIVVGIYQNYSLDGTTYNYIRGSDASWDRKTGKFSKSSSKFYDFIENELLVYLTDNYRIGEFKAILGHSLTASFIGSIILENDNNFYAYILLSPNLLDFKSNLFDNIENGIQNKLVYLCTSDYDMTGHKSSINKLNEEYFSISDFEKTHYKFQTFKDENHISLINRSIPFAIEHIFKLYQPINNLDEKAFFSNENKIDFLNNLYESSNQLYGTNREIRDTDLEELADIAIKRKDWLALKEIADLDIELHPNSETGYYSRARFEEIYNKDLKSALIFFKKGYSKLEPEVLNKVDWYEEIERVEKLIEKR